MTPQDAPEGPAAEVHLYRDGDAAGLWTRCAGCGDRIGHSKRLPDGVQSKLETLDTFGGMLPDAMTAGDLTELTLDVELPGFTIYGACCDRG